jgi:hypothetical protein
MKIKIKKSTTGKGAATMQSTNFVAIMAILNAIAQRFNNDAVKTHLASLVRPLAAGVTVNEAFAADTKTK